MATATCKLMYNITIHMTGYGVRILLTIYIYICIRTTLFLSTFFPSKKKTSAQKIDPCRPPPLFGDNGMDPVHRWQRLPQKNTQKKQGKRSHLRGQTSSHNQNSDWKGNIGINLSVIQNKQIIHFLQDCSIARGSGAKALQATWR